LRDALSAADRLAADEKIAGGFLSSDIYFNAEKIFVYVSMGSEAGTHAIIETAVKSGKTVAAPRAEGGAMRFYRISSTIGLVRSAFGIMEPAGDERELALCDLSTVVIAPGLAFNRNGYRLGYGMGYYDKYLNENAPMARVGLCYGFQVTDELRPKPWDVAMDALLTEKGWMLSGGDN